MENLTPNGSKPNTDMELAPEFRAKWMRIRFAADFLGVDLSTIYKDISKGKLRTFRIAPNLTLVSRRDILKWEPGKPGRPPKKRRKQRVMQTDD